MQELKMSIIGGDLRQVYMANILCKKGFSVGVFGINSSTVNEDTINFSSLEKAMDFSNIIICPIPFSKDKRHIFSQTDPTLISISDFVSLLKPEHQLFGGDISTYVKAACTALDIDCYDFMDMEQVCIKNAIATAEGTIAEAICASNINLHKSNCLVLGYGRCAKIIADKLKGLGAKVTVAARNSRQLALATALGFEVIPLHQINTLLWQCDYIFNTIPAAVLKKDEIDLLNSNVLIIDIASNSGGTDFSFCKEHGIKALLCQGLPGKYAPKITAEILTDALLQELNQSNLFYLN